MPDSAGWTGILSNGLVPTRPCSSFKKRSESKCLPRSAYDNMRKIRRGKKGLKEKRWKILTWAPVKAPSFLVHWFEEQLSTFFEPSSNRKSSLYSILSRQWFGNLGEVSFAACETRPFSRVSSSKESKVRLAHAY